MSSNANDVANVDSRSSLLWTCIFKDRKWLELAEKIAETDACTPLLIGNDLSQTDAPGQYFILLSGDYSGDLTYEKKTLFGSLREDREYDEERQEVRFKSGLAVNISQVISGTDEPRLPIMELFSGRTDFQLEYLFLNEATPTIHTLSPCNIIGINGPIKKICDIQYGCVLHIPYKEGTTQWIMIEKDAIKKVVVDKRGPEVDMRDQCELIMSLQVE